MADYISREALLEKAWDADTRVGYVQVADVGDILAAPAADVVEVVRCRDCKYRRKNDENEPYCIAKDGLSDPWDDEFCSHGERKEQEHDPD